MNETDRCTGVVDRSRRRGVLALGGLAGTLLLPASATASTRDAIIEQPDSPAPEAFMARAALMRERAIADADQGYGAVVVRAGRIVGEAPSRVVSAGDPTAHAEMEAIRDAARRLGTRRLAGCILYSTSRACPMCESAAYWSGIDGMVYGASLGDGGAPRLGGC